MERQANVLRLLISVSVLVRTSSRKYILYDQKLVGMKKKRPEGIKIVLQKRNKSILQFPGHLGAREPTATVQGIPKLYA